MKNLNLIRLLFLSCILFSCQPKKEIKKLVINPTIQNYKYDDDDPRNKSYHDTIETKKNLDLKKAIK